MSDPAQARKQPRTQAEVLRERLAKAPFDDEPYTDEERAAVEQARKAPRSEDVSSDELRRLLGL